ncbi:MAG: hypothetical protein GYB36_08430 [Alphaproteobacteria bacterium]|nr:hypothetical protein [Alphaproteobacteria bacterium]
MLRSILSFCTGLLLTASVTAQEPAPQRDHFEEQVELLREHFRWIDVADMRAIRGSLRAAIHEAENCSAGECDDFDCPAANGSLAQVGELAMRLSAMENTLAYMHELELAHLRNLHEGANLTEAEAAYQNEVLFWQGAVITSSAAFIQIALIFGDLQSGLMADGPLSAASAIDELIRDSITLYQDMNSFRANASPRFRQRTDDLLNTINTLTDYKSNFENLANAAVDGGIGYYGDAREQLFMALGRTVRSWALEQLAIRQAEVAALNDDAFRERSEANAFATRLRGLGLQREMAAMMAEYARDLHHSLGLCAQSNCAIDPPALPDAPRVLRPADPTSPINMPRIDHEVLERNSARIQSIGLQLPISWTRRQCDIPEPPEQTPPSPAAGAQGPRLNEGQILENCRTLRNVGICSIVTEDRRDACEAHASIAVASCVELPRVGERLAAAEPMSPAFQQGLGEMCRATCGLLYGLDYHLDAQRYVALAQIAELEADHIEAGGTLVNGANADPLRSRLRELLQQAAARFTVVSYNPASDTYTQSEALPEGDILISLQPGQMNAQEREEADRIRDLIEANDTDPDWQPRSVWGEAAARFWRTYGNHQFLTCGSPQTETRFAQCIAGCSNGGMASYSACAVSAPDITLDLGPVLYPPGDPRGEAIEPFSARGALEAARMGGGQ